MKSEYYDKHTKELREWIKREELKQNIGIGFCVVFLVVYEFILQFFFVIVGGYVFPPTSPKQWRATLLEKEAFGAWLGIYRQILKNIEEEEGKD